MIGESRLATGVAAAVVSSTGEVASGGETFDVDLTIEIGKLVAKEFELRAPADDRPIVAGPRPASASSSDGLIDKHARASSAARSDGGDCALPEAGRGSLHRKTNQQHQLNAKPDDVALDIAGRRMEERPTDNALVRPGRRGRVDAGDPEG